MLSVSDITQYLNERIASVIPNAKTYGIAKQAAIGDKTMPYCDGAYIGVDDTYPMQAYHKQLSIASVPVVARSGYGDSEGYMQNTYGMAIIIYFDEKKLQIAVDELYTFIQSQISGIIKAEGFKSIRIAVNNAILNDEQVWRQEYGNVKFPLSGSQRLIQIGYSVQATLDKKCVVIKVCNN